MANVQKENGFTPVAHELLEAIRAADFGGTELKILIDVLDRTYGYGKKTAWFSSGYLANFLNINERTGRRAVEALVDRRVLVRSTVTEGVSKQRHLGINKHYDQWDVVFSADFAARALRDFGVLKLPTAPKKRCSKNARCVGGGVQTPQGLQTPTCGGVQTPQIRDIKKEVVVDTRVTAISSTIKAKFEEWQPTAGNSMIYADLLRFQEEHGEANVVRSIEEAMRFTEPVSTPTKFLEGKLSREKARGYTWQTAAERGQSARTSSPPLVSKRDPEAAFFAPIPLYQYLEADLATGPDYAWMRVEEEARKLGIDPAPYARLNDVPKPPKFEQIELIRDFVRATLRPSPPPTSTHAVEGTAA